MPLPTSPPLSVSKAKRSKITTPSKAEKAEDLGRNPKVPNYTLKYSLTHHAPSSVKFSPDGKYLASAGDDKIIRIWKVEDGELEKILEGHTKEVNDVAWSSDSDQLVSASDDRTLIMWDVFESRYGGYQNEIRLVGHVSEVFCCTYNPKAYFVASGSVDGSLIIWDVLSQSSMYTMPAHTDTVSAVDFNRDGDLLVTCGFDGSCRVWDVKNSGHCLYHLVDPVVLEDGIPPSLWFAKFSPSGKYVLAGFSDSTLKLFDFKASTIEKTYIGHDSGTLCTSGDSSEPGDETWVVSGSEDNLVYIWDMVTKEVMQKLEGHTDAVLAAVFHPKLNMIATAGNDHAVKVWEWISDK